MTRAVDEIDRLDGIVPVTPQAVAELITEIKQLRAEIERLRKDTLHWEHQNGLLEDKIARLTEALRPFAEYADPREAVPPSLAITTGSKMARRQLTMRDCYRARDAALEDKP